MAGTVPRALAFSLLLGLIALGSPGRVSARDKGFGAAGPVPEKNYSFVHDEVEWVVGAFRSAAAAAAEGRWAQAVRDLQRVVGTEEEPPPGQEPASGDAVPAVLAVNGSTTYEGAWIVARHQIVRWGDAAVAAHEAEFGGAARDLLDAAIARQDPRLLALAARRYLPTKAGRAAALLRVDLALEAGDTDMALGVLQALEDLEEVSTESAELLEPWRAARIARHARALAKTAEDVAPLVKALRTDPRRALGLDGAMAYMADEAPLLTDWRTTGGNAARSGTPAALGTRFKWAWSLTDVLADKRDPFLQEFDHPSVFLPPRAATSGPHAFISDGQDIHVIDIEAGKEITFASIPGLSPPLRNDHGRDLRERYGLIEGHALTLLTSREAGLPEGQQLLIAAISDGEAFPVTADGDDRREPRDDRLVAFRFDGKELHPHWIAGGEDASPGLEANTRLYGAPLLYRGLLWSAAIRPAMASGDQWEAWLVALDPRSGRARHRVHVGTGTPVRRARIDEVIPTSPAGQHGRIVVGTAIGMLAAIDADTARVSWLYRYDREVDPLRERRNANTPSPGQRPTGFSNEPPVLALGRCFAAPIDGRDMLILMNRPRLDARVLLSDSLGREVPGIANMSIEAVAGVISNQQALVIVGRGQEKDELPGPIVAVWDPLQRVERWRETGPTRDGLELFGRALVTPEEVFVSTPGGIAIYDLASGEDLGVLDHKDLPEGLRATLTAPFGNLIPIPGKGILAVSATTVTFWKRTK